MGLLRILVMLVLQIWFFCISDLRAQSVSSARSLDALLQGYAYKAFAHPRTGISYDGAVPANLTGIKIAALRLRSGSLRTRGVEMYKEFEIPVGVIVLPYVQRLVLVYQNLGNWSEEFYPPLSGYTYLAPVVGLLAYDAANLSATNIPELGLQASGNPIRINFPDVQWVSNSTAAKCVRFDLQGSAIFSDLTSGSKCSSNQQGHFSVVVESTAPPPQPVPPKATINGGKVEKNRTNSKVFLIVGSVSGGLVLIVAGTFLFLWALKYERRKKMDQMMRASEAGEALKMTSVGGTKAPAASVTRTQPFLESEYAL